MDPPRTPAPLEPPVLSALRGQQAGTMERSLSQDIRDEREILREVAEQTLNAIVDLNLDGTIKWVSPSWNDVVGVPFESVSGQPISDLIISEPKTVFTDVVESMQRDDSKSHKIRFTMKLGPLSKLRSSNEPKTEEAPDSEEETVDLEAQGIMVYDSVSGGESHTMWMFGQYTRPHEVQIDLPDVIVDSLGSGAEVLASYLTQLADSSGDELEHPAPPPPALCRICERQIQPWWYEKHTELCLQEHRAEMDVQMAHENLTEHRHAIVKVLDALEARKSRSMSGEPQTLPLAEYKGMPIGPPPSTQSSPGTSLARSRERSGGFGHARARSFAIRRPQARIVELLMDLCDTAVDISTPTMKETASQQDPGEFRTLSPQSESRISQVLQWQSPSSNTLEQEQGLALLCSDTENVAHVKVDAVSRHRKILEYAERIRIEMAVLVQDCIDEALRKAARIAAGRLSDSSEDEGQDVQYEDAPVGDEGNKLPEEAEPAPAERQQPELPSVEEEESRGRSDSDAFKRHLHSPSALASALRQVDLSSDNVGRSRPASYVGSTRSSSPRECPTPRSNFGGPSTGSQTRESRRETSLLSEGDIAESEGSMRSSSAASRTAQRTDSPISEFGDLRRAASSRQHHRRSLVLPGTSSPRRQESPSRPAPPSSPLRIKPRGMTHSHDGVASPEGSPMLPSSDYGSPNPLPSRHHRRQSSAAISDFVMRPPPSPRLGSQAPPHVRSTQPSIKDFEIIKPISKGAFGSVYLSKKKSTGEYFAIKVLKKADMVAKNQVGNVKAERAIMMWQGQSEFVAKLYWTFSSKDYLYLVMEYLNGGDCASLIKVLGGLPEEWVKKYLGEVVLGVEHLHSRGIIHRDLKPDNLLIDQKGHLKLTDFGLSRMGLVGRQKRALDNENAETTPDLLKQGPFARSTSMASSRSTSLDLHGHAHSSPSMTPQMTPDVSGLGQPSYFTLGSTQHEPRRTSAGQRSDSGGSETLTRMLGAFSLNDPDAVTHQANTMSPMEEEAVTGSPDLPLTHTSSRVSMDSHTRYSLPQSQMMPPAMALFDPEDTNRRFVGTPDYLAPETINGDKQDETSDWWSVGCILFEFLYGIPPFHAGEAEHVFENILARKIQWPDDEDCETVISEDAKDLINKLLCMAPDQRLGASREDKFASGGEEIRSHPWFEGVNWDTLLEDEAEFVPQTEDPEDTEYFDARGAVLQSFAEEMEDQSPQSSAAGSEYPERPHDALSRVRSQVNSVTRKLMPLHIPPHVRDHKSRRLSEPTASDDFGSFAFKNLPVLEKANKDVIQKLRAEALAAQTKAAGTSSSSSSGAGAAGPSSPAPSLEGSPVMPQPLQRTISNAKAGNRPQSPSGLNHSNSSPSRPSQPSSPLMVSFVAGQGAEGRRKASSNSSSLSHQSAASLQPSASIDVPRVPPSLQKAATSLSASPVKGRGSGPPPPAPPPLSLSPQKSMISTPQPASKSSANRSRSLTVGSQESSPVSSDLLHHHRRSRRSQVFDMSPSSSDNEGDKHNALLRVQRRRQSSRRLSQIAFDGGPMFRPLDVLICEDHPVSRMVMEKLLEKLRCRTISVANGSEAVRYSMSEIKFDVIFLEYKLPQINGADVARMIRETKNANSHTPIVAITAYLKELQAPHYFDSLIEKPISSSKLTEVLRSLCQWRPESPGQAGTPSNLHRTPVPMKKTSVRADDSPTSSVSALAGRQASAVASSREDSITSSVFGDSESATTDEIPVVISRKATGDWEESGGLGITDTNTITGTRLEGSPQPLPQPLPQLNIQHSAPAQMEQSQWPAKGKRDMMEKRLPESTDSADDEDDELGTTRGDKHAPRVTKSMSGKTSLPSSKLGIEMMRANSHDSLNVGATESSSESTTQVSSTPRNELETPPTKRAASSASGADNISTATLTPPALGSGDKSDSGSAGSSVDATPRPLPPGRSGSGFLGGGLVTSENEATPRPPGK